MIGQQCATEVHCCSSLIACPHPDMHDQQHPVTALKEKAYFFYLINFAGDVQNVVEAFGILAFLLFALLLHYVLKAQKVHIVADFSNFFCRDILNSVAHRNGTRALPPVPNEQAAVASPFSFAGTAN